MNEVHVTDILGCGPMNIRLDHTCQILMNHTQMEYHVLDHTWSEGHMELVEGFVMWMVMGYEILQAARDRDKWGGAVGMDTHALTGQSVHGA